jgi:hypothetical protein
VSSGLLDRSNSCSPGLLDPSLDIVTTPTFLSSPTTSGSATSPARSPRTRSEDLDQHSRDGRGGNGSVDLQVEARHELSLVGVAHLLEQIIPRRRVEEVDLVVQDEQFRAGLRRKLGQLPG